MKAILRIQAAIILSISLNYYSCDDNPVDPVKQTVSGKIYSMTKATLSNLKVTIQGKTTTTSSDGSYSLSDIEFPYDALITSEFGQTRTFHRNLSSTVADLMMSYVDRASLVSIGVTIPDSIFYKELSILIIFSDGKNISNYKYIDRQTVPSTIDFGFGYAEPPYTGKFYLLTFKQDNNSNLISYENFGISEDITVGSGMGNYNFTSEQISFNPGELDVPVNINSGGNTSLAFTEYYIGFSKEKIYNGAFQRIQLFTASQFILRIPADLPVKCYNFLSAASNSGNGGGTERYLVDPGGQNNFTLRDNPSLISPEDGAVVTDTTKFTFATGDGTGVYNIIFYNSEFSASVFQSTASIEFRDMRSLIPTNVASDQITWYVNKLGTISSMNNFTEEFFRNEASFKTGSYSRIFSYK